MNKWRIACAMGVLTVESYYLFHDFWKIQKADKHIVRTLDLARNMMRSRDWKMFLNVWTGHTVILLWGHWTIPGTCLWQFKLSETFSSKKKYLIFCLSMIQLKLYDICKTLIHHMTFKIVFLRKFLFYFCILVWVLKLYRIFLGICDIAKYCKTSTNLWHVVTSRKA